MQDKLEIEWSWTDDNGIEHYEFEESLALAELLNAEVVFLNSRWYRTEDQNLISVSVLCNDIFAWGCADAESLPFAEIELLWHMWKKDPIWGPAIWCCKSTNMMPQSPVAKAIEKAGIWDLKSYNLKRNS